LVAAYLVKSRKFDFTPRLVAKSRNPTKTQQAARREGRRERERERGKKKKSLCLASLSICGKGGGAAAAVGGLRRM
jgi:hypothetical protein